VVRNVVAVLIAISAIGMLGIPLGDPRFLAVSVALEISYIVLAILSVKKVKYVLIPNIVIASIVITGNTFSPTHLGIILALNPIYNAIILITGGYILQVLLIVTSILAHKNMKQAITRDNM